MLSFANFRGIMLTYVAWTHGETVCTFSLTHLYSLIVVISDRGDCHANGRAAVPGYKHALQEDVSLGEVPCECQEGSDDVDRASHRKVSPLAVWSKTWNEATSNSCVAEL